MLSGVNKKDRQTFWQAWRYALLLWACGVVLGVVGGFQLSRMMPKTAPGRYAPIGTEARVALNTATGQLCAIDEPDNDQPGLPVCGR